MAAIINRTQDRFNSSNLIFISTFIFRERAPRLPYYNSAAAAAATSPRPYGVSNRPFRGYFLRLQTEGNLLLLLIAKGGERMIHPLTPPPSSGLRQGILVSRLPSPCLNRRN